MKNRLRPLHSQWMSKTLLMLFLFWMGAFGLYAQGSRVVEGTVVDSRQEPLYGVTIMVKGRPGVGVITDFDGRFSIQLSEGDNELELSFLGMRSQTLRVGERSHLMVVMEEDSQIFDEVVIVGFGQQKKASVVAAITQTTGEQLERAGGVSSVGAALTGNVPGVITSSSTGMPGEEDPRIVIRGSSTWNNSAPLVLVDGIERPMNSVDIGSIETISVLKDASATAVYGVRGANGVILITTKRGKEGRADIRVNVNTTIKSPSKLPGKLDSYDAIMVKNNAIEYELGLKPESWSDYVPYERALKYRNPASLEEAERYPNVDWQDALFKDYAMAYNANVSVGGGTDFVRYFVSADYLNEGDLFKVYDNNRGYEAGYGYNRMNVRSNLDFDLSPSTTFSVNLAGSRGERKRPWNASGSDYSYWIAAYSTAPDLFLPRYSDGNWGYNAVDEQRGLNSVRILATSGMEFTTTNQINTDFSLSQDLGMLVKGLSFKGTVSLDNTFVEAQRGINDLYNNSQLKWIDPETGVARYKELLDSSSRFDFAEGVNWAISKGEVRNWETYRSFFYQTQLNYATTINELHDITAMGLFSRNEHARGSEIPYYREDWVFRATYNYGGKYTIEYNGAYNGSEKFSPENRFAFFSSGGANWMISEENFMQSLGFLDMLRLRASYGEIGDDNVNGRWLYMTQWAYDDPNGGQTRIGTEGETPATSPYTWYREDALGNPNVQWEKVQKTNFGVDYSFFNNLIAGSFDYFEDKRTDILITGDNRAIPSYFGAKAPVANLGRVQVKGYELELRLNKRVGANARVYGNFNLTHSKSEVLERDDPQLLPAYQKQVGYVLGQTRSHVSNGYINTWDELYASTPHDANDNQKLPGDYHIIDFNGDGIIDTNDNIPFGFSATPQNTYSSTIGFEWNGFAGFAQFYGVNNVTRQVVLGSLERNNTLVYDEGSYWSKNQMDADVPHPRWNSTPSNYSVGNRYMFDGSYLRLKNAEISYTFNSRWNFMRKSKIETLRVFVNGNNLWVWTDMPDDRESNFAGTGWASQGAYPTVKRYNIGLNLTF